MNVGHYGIPARQGTGMYQSPWFPFEKFVATKHYIFPHPYPHTPTTARQLYRCKKADNQFVAGMVWQQCVTYQGGGDGSVLILRPNAIEMVMGSLGVFRFRNAAGANFVGAVGSWEFAILVIS